MIHFDLYALLILALMCVPISWLAPRTLAFDAVAVWTLISLFAYSPATVLWLVSIVLALSFILPRGTNHRNGTALVLTVLLVAGLFASRTLPGWGWVGGAFFTLRALHVVAEWWMGRLLPPSLRDCLRYFFFLPVLVAGPVNRLPHFLHQLRRRRFDAAEFFSGIERVLFGLVMMYVLGGWFSQKLEKHIANIAFGWPSFWAVWLHSVAEWVQLFFVFFGSSSVALGVALMMGLTLEENFNRPWVASSLIDFWRRWHMSLTSWVQDYVFRPLAAVTRQPLVGLVASMLVVGMWHEVSVYYVLWSVWQTLGIIMSRVLSRWTFFIRIPAGLLMWIGPPLVFAWLTAARPVILLLVGEIP